MNPAIIFIFGLVVTMFVAGAFSLVGFGYAVDERAKRQSGVAAEPSQPDLAVR